MGEMLSPQGIEVAFHVFPILGEAFTYAVDRWVPRLVCTSGFPRELSFLEHRT